MFKKAILLLLIVFAGFQQLSAQNPEKDLYLETMGVLSSQNIYMSYVYLGNIADSYIHEAITKEFCLKLLNEYVLILDATKNQTTKLYESGYLDQEGNEAILMQIDIYQLLVAEAKAYLDFVKSGENHHIEAFEQNRVWAWNKIEKLLGIKGSVEAEK